MSLVQATFSAPSFARFGSITAITKTGEKKELNFEEDDNLFTILVDAEVISKSGTCMGNMACGKCHIKHVSGTVPEIEEEEQEFLEGQEAGTRLACAINLTEDNNGATFQAL